MRNGMRMGGVRGGPMPYDKGGRRPMNGNSNNNNAGRLSPPRGLPPRGGRPSFTEGGIGTFGGAQAVEGRTMKSYNDLDAAGGNQNGSALDY